MKLQVVGSNEYAFLSKDNEFNSFGGNGENKSLSFHGQMYPVELKALL